MIQAIENAIEEIKNGRIIILVDSEDRENEGDLVIAAEFADHKAINFMATHGRGLICIPMLGERLAQLGLAKMVDKGGDHFGTAFTVSVDAKKDVSTGISAADRAKTIQTLLDENTKPDDLTRPGHLFPLEAVPGGVLRRAGHTEASTDIAELAGLQPAAVICEIMNEDGSMARMDDLHTFAKKHDLNIYTIEDLIRYRLQKDKLVTLEAEARLPTEYGNFQVKAYSTHIDDKTHVALIKGKVDENSPILVRVHSECLTEDIFFSQRSDCSLQLHRALRQIEKEGAGILLYMRQEGGGHRMGLINKLKAYNSQGNGLDTVEVSEKVGFPADLRDYGIGAQILQDNGVKKMRLMTNNPRKIVGLEGYGLEIIDRVPIEIDSVEENYKYLLTKKNKLGHILGIH
ncbi:MAG: bifunctional 3,4-dihydroxy-2-butanone-4-phosphate synthase/GTP cyclohydrolase II [Spirochaetota bacterium]